MPGNRRSIRLNDYDYTEQGVYYVTICVEGRKCVFGDVWCGEIILNGMGRIVARNWNELPEHFPNIKIDEFIVMPNHTHGIINIVGAGFPRPDDNGYGNDGKGRGDHDKGRGNRAPTLGQIVAYFKYGTTKQINAIRQTPGIRLWQRNYYEHIVRNEPDLARIREYIVNNPVQWEEDEYFSPN